MQLPVVCCRGGDICSFTILRSCPLVVKDVKRHFPDAFAVHGVTTYAGVPLINKRGFALGSLCSVNWPAEAMPDKLIEKMQSIAGVVVDYMESQRESVALMRQTSEQLRLLESLGLGGDACASVDASRRLNTPVDAAVDRLIQLQRNASVDPDTRQQVT